MQTEKAVAFVAGQRGRWVGQAFLIGPRKLVTCAHVVNTALARRDKLDPTAPEASARLMLSFPFGAATAGLFEAAVERWIPAGEWRPERDVAVLVLDRDPPHGLPVLETATPPSGPVRVQMCGPSEGDRVSHVLGELVGASAPGLRQVNQLDGNAYRVALGFSGGPVWLPDTGAVVGIMRAANLSEDGSAAECVDLGVLDDERADDGYVLDPNRREPEWGVYDFAYRASVRRILGPGNMADDPITQRRILERLRLDGRDADGRDAALERVGLYLSYLQEGPGGFDRFREMWDPLRKGHRGITGYTADDTPDGIRLRILWLLLAGLAGELYGYLDACHALLDLTRRRPDVDPLDRAELYVLAASSGEVTPEKRSHLWHAWRIRRARLGADHPLTLVTRAYMYMVGLDEEATTGHVNGLSELMPALDDMFGRDSRAVIAFRTALTDALTDLDRTGEAIEIGRANLAVADAAFGEYEDVVLDARAALAEALMAENRAEEFVDLLGPRVTACLTELPLNDVLAIGRYLAERQVERDDYGGAVGTLGLLAERLAADTDEYGLGHETTEEVRRELAELQMDRELLHPRP